MNDGHELPTIAFGTGSALFRRDATAYVEQAIDTGFSHIDTAAGKSTLRHVIFSEYLTHL